MQTETRDMTMTATTPPAETAGQADPDTALAAKLLLAVLVFLAGWATSVALWGIPGLYIPALALVPVIYVVLILISRG